MPSRARGVLSMVMVLVIGLVAQACSSSEGSETITVNGVELTEAEFFYGKNVETHPDVTYQDDVVLIPNGASAVRSVSVDRLTWVVNRKARGVDQLAVGKVMFLTSYAVGRVIHLEEDGNDLHVWILPVELDEIFWEAKFEGVVELDLDDSIQFDTSHFPWTVTDAPTFYVADEEGEEDLEGLLPSLIQIVSGDQGEPGTGGPGDGGPGDGGPGDGGSGGGGESGGGNGDSGEGGGEEKPGLPLDREDPYGPGYEEYARKLAEKWEQDRKAINDFANDFEKTVRKASVGQGGRRQSGDFTIGSLTGGILGLDFTYLKGATAKVGKITFMEAKPSVEFTIDISDGALQVVEFTVKGQVVLGYYFQFASEKGIADNINKIVEVPVEVNIPLPPIAGVSLTFTLSQTFLLGTAFSAPESAIHAGGKWILNGEFGLGYRRVGGLSVRGASTATIVQDLATNIGGKSLGATGVVMAHNGKLDLGVGWIPFKVGPYVEVRSSIGVVRGSDMAWPYPRCIIGMLQVEGAVGVGYRIPAIVVKIVNWLFDAVGIDSRLEQHGKIAEIKRTLIKLTKRYFPRSPVCNPDGPYAG